MAIGEIHPSISLDEQETTTNSKILLTGGIIAFGTVLLTSYNIPVYGIHKETALLKITIHWG